MKSTCIFTLVLTCGFAQPAPVELDQLPRVIDYRLPSVPAAVDESEAEVDLLVEINEQGRVIYAAVKRATDPRLAVPCLKVIRRWRYAPATQNGSPVPATFVQPLHFGPDEIVSVTLVSAPARVRRRVSPVIPAGLEHLDAEVTVALSVDSAGAVTDVTVVDSTAQQLNDATVDAALQWTFKPAVRDDLNVPSKVFIPFHYKTTDEASSGRPHRSRLSAGSSRSKRAAGP